MGATHNVLRCMSAVIGNTPEENAFTLMQDTNSLGIVTPQTAYFDTPLHLKSGAVLENYELVYETYGELNAAKSNAVLVCHALSGNHHLAGVYEDNPKSVGWWNNMIGAGKSIDTREVFRDWGE